MLLCLCLEGTPSTTNEQGDICSEVQPLVQFLQGAHRTPCARRAHAVRILGPARVMTSADLSSPRGRTRYLYAPLKPWPRSGPPPVSSAHMHANIGRRAARSPFRPMAALALVENTSLLPDHLTLCLPFLACIAYHVAVIATYIQSRVWLTTPGVSPKTFCARFLPYYFTPAGSTCTRGAQATYIYINHVTANFWWSVHCFRWFWGSALNVVSGF